MITNVFSYLTYSTFKIIARIARNILVEVFSYIVLQHEYLPSLAVPMSSSSIARICSWADIAQTFWCQRSQREIDRSTQFSCT